MDLHIASLQDLKRVAVRFLQVTGDCRHFAFYGAMGAGKTTFIKALCAELGVTDPVTSPTFAIVNAYRTPIHGWVYHFDFYRLENPSDAFDFGGEEYFESRYYCFVEWPERGEVILPDSVCRVYITEQPDGSRLVSLPSL